jgi:hypothetical protein
LRPGDLEVIVAKLHNLYGLGVLFWRDRRIDPPAGF